MVGCTAIGAWQSGAVVTASSRCSHACYVMRAYLPPKDTPEALSCEEQTPLLWPWYTQFVQVEESPRTRESLPNLRPIHRQIESPVEGQVLVVFLAFCLTVTLRMKLTRAAPGLTPDRDAPVSLGDRAGGRAHPRHGRPCTGHAAVHRTEGAAAENSGETEPEAAKAATTADSKQRSLNADEPANETLWRGP